jgi:hypothetical protein
MTAYSFHTKRETLSNLGSKNGTRFPLISHEEAVGISRNMVELLRQQRLFHFRLLNYASSVNQNGDNLQGRFNSGISTDTMGFKVKRDNKSSKTEQIPWDLGFSRRLRQVTLSCGI